MKNARFIHHPHIADANWHPFLPKNTGRFGQFGWSGVLRGASVIFFAYIGFDAVSTTAQEARNPQKDMPIGIILFPFSHALNDPDNVLREGLFPECGHAWRHGCVSQ